MGSVIEATCGKDLAETMVERIVGTKSHAEALRTLRTAFPESPLTARVAALAMLERFDAFSAANRKSTPDQVRGRLSPENAMKRFDAFTAANRTSTPRSSPGAGPRSSLGAGFAGNRRGTGGHIPR
jgi:hypothetical protein